MKKSLFMVALAVCAGWLSACSDDDESATGQAVGITAVTVTPSESAIGYNCTIDQTTLQVVTSADSVDWMVTDEALRHATVVVSPTMGATATINGTEVPAAGLEVDVTAPVTIQVSNGSTTVAYTLTVVRATTAAGDDMRLIATTFQGMPSPLYDVDVTYFNDRFYAITTSLTGEGDAQVENYQLFSSEDGINWTEVNYQASNNGVVLPEGQTGWSVGGEGARLAVFNDRMYVLGGARTQAADRYGEAAEVTQGWFGPSPALSIWRSASTADGLKFEADTIGGTYVGSDGSVSSLSSMANAYVTPVVFKNALYVKDGYAPVMGMWQGKASYARTTDGKNWEEISVNPSEANVPRFRGSAFFAFKDKLWCIGGYKPAFPSTSNIGFEIWSSEDGENWTQEDNTNAEPVLGWRYGMKAVANDQVAYIFGGMLMNEDGTKERSNKVFRSTDGVNWEEVEMPDNYQGAYMPSVVLVGNAAYIFGGFDGNNDTYASPSGSTVSTSTWVKLMN